MRRVVLLALAAAAAAHAQRVDPSSLDGKVLLGYQGWFRCPGGGALGMNWSHWANGVPSAASLVIDMYPDMREFEPGEACAVPGMSIGGAAAYLFSSGSSRTVDRHFEWMRQYGLDGVLAQRFLTDIPGNRGAGDPVLRNVMAAAEKYGRIFAIEYDVTGANPATVANDLQQDWMYLVNTLRVTESPAYLRHNGKPLVSVWGLGFSGGRNPPETAAAAAQIVSWFRSTAGVTYLGGTPSRWRTLDGDSYADAGWTDVYRSMDVVQPWTVGRYNNVAGADSWLNSRIRPDMQAVSQTGQIYMPVIFPGFSWYNLNRTAAQNQIPRNRGEFLWRQAYNAKLAGATTLKIAMFDEVNESTAMFKVAPRRQDAPEQGYWLTLDADGFTLPSDWYLRLAGEITRMFRAGAAAAATMPERPGPPFAGDPALAVLSAATFAPDWLASEGLGTIFGANLANGAVTVVDSSGQARRAQVLYGSETQINFLVPAGTTPGRATVIVNREGDVAAGASEVARVAPGIFAGVAVAGDRPAVVLYGTGIRNRTGALTCDIDGVDAAVLYAGPQPEYPGLDQVNVELPTALIGRARVAVAVSVDGRPANAVSVDLR